MELGEMATLTQTLTDEAIELLAGEFDKKVEIVHAADEVEDEPQFEDADEDLVERPPVVTIMGHVDHGKTSLLDAIRQTEVAAGEAGGITQHIGAYQVHHNDSTITFLDTPGHQAFTAMRARGAKVTDIAVIVVAADDGVMPQTREAIDHAKAAGVPVMVAVNKIDKEGADPNRVRGELAQEGLTPADWGGDTEFSDVSAKTRQGLDELLENIVTLADLQELRANPKADASGVVVESRLDPGRGPVVTILVERGTLHVSDALVAGAHWGRVRAMSDFRGQKVKSASPGEPVEILGFDGVPEAGEHVRVVENERKARSLAAERSTRLKAEALARRAGVRVSLEDVFARAQEGGLQELNLILKADVAGSLEALADEIAKLPQQQVRVSIIHDAVGGINESDVMLAAASDAIIIGFNVRPVGDAGKVAEREGVEIRTYDVIYNIVSDLRSAMEGLLAPEEVEHIVGTAEVRQTFKASRVGTIAGSYVTSGVIRRGASVRLVRDGTVVWTGRIGSLAPLPGGRPRGCRGLRVRCRARRLRRRQGGRRARMLRDARGRARPRVAAAAPPAAGELRLPDRDPSPLPGGRQPEGQAPGAAVAEGPAPAPVRRGGGRDRPPRAVAALDAHGRRGGPHRVDSRRHWGQARALRGVAIPGRGTGGTGSDLG